MSTDCHVSVIHGGQLQVPEVILNTAIRGRVWQELMFSRLRFRTSLHERTLAPIHKCWVPFQRRTFKAAPAGQLLFTWNHFNQTRRGRIMALHYWNWLLFPGRSAPRSVCPILITYLTVFRVVTISINSRRATPSAMSCFRCNHLKPAPIGTYGLIFWDDRCHRAR